MKERIRNILILLLGILVFGTILCNNQVKATEVDLTYLENIIKMIPDSMNLNIPEIEYEKAESIIAEKVQEILKENNIECSVDNTDRFRTKLILKEITYNNSEVSIYIGASQLYLGIEEFYNAHIYIDNGIQKDIKLTYNNHDKYNVNDEKYVKGLKIESPRIYGLEIEEFSNMDAYGFPTMVEEYYTRLLNDDSVEIKATAGAGWTELLNCGADTVLGIFKNGILYDIKLIGGEDAFPLINVPKDVSDEEFNDFISTKIKKHCLEYNKDNWTISNITKGARYNETDIQNGYTVYLTYLDGEPIECYIIVNREYEVDTEDKKTNIKLETTSNILPEDTTLVVEKITTGESYNTVVATLGDTIDKFVLYDITLKSNGVEVQPNGKVKISIPIPDGFNKEKLVVYRIDNDGTKVKYDVKIETIEEKEYATFETEHFSLYTLAMEKIEETKNENKVDESTNQDTNKNENKLDATPKTGNANLMVYVLPILVISLIAIVVLKKNNK